VLFQKQMLEEEYARWGAGRVQGFPEWAVERELGEYESADAIVVPSGFARRTFLERGVLAHKLHLCPYGVDLSFFSPRPRRDAAFRVLFVGSASIRKGIGYLFDAVRPLVERRHVELWLVGAVSRDARGILARNRTIFSHRGFVPRPRLAELYSQGSVLVLPSVEEGLALVQAQAMACGVPVIATPNTGAEDLFDDGKEGFIVPVRDRTAIRERVAWMIAHPEARRAMGEAALRRVRSRGGWREYGAAVERAYATLCRENLPVAPCSPSQSVTAHGAPNGTRVS
jgi:glycosyltransferase involved in cell wall biosynthesis